MNTQPFSPGSTTTVAVTTTTASGALPGGGSVIEVQNVGTVTVFVVLGASTVTATNAGYPILAGQSKMISRNVILHTHIAAIAGTGTATLYATTGEGV